jgi:exodeoxyribonuclease V beta subunit
MHSIMEQVDFKRASLTTHDEQTRHTVENILRGSGICLKDDKAATEEAVKETTELYLQMLPSWMTRPLSGEGEIRLADIDRADRSAEIRFSLACDLNPKMAEEIAALLADDATPGSLLAINRIAPSEEAVRGLLTGSIDLAFRHSGKFYLVDWKSNVLGPKPAHYARNVMEAEILAHKYHLQYTLYAAIFHRHMQALNPDWDYERDFGGCHYLFMRAFGHDDQGTGDFFHRPGFVTIQRLLKALGQKDA